MKVLHLFSNCKWTGPAEPALNLCVALRALGVEADFACAPNAGASINKIVETARDRGIEPILDFHLSKHRKPILNWLDRRTLFRLLSRTRYDIAHCHLDNDHRIAVGPAAKLHIPLVRSSYDGEGFTQKRDHYRLLRYTTRLIEPSRRAALHDARAFGFPSARMDVIPNAVDVERFDPARDVPDARARLQIPRDAFVIGIIARMQTHRHFSDFFAAVRRLIDAGENAHAIVIGRGTKQETVGYQPVRELKLESHVHFPGFTDGDDYVGLLKACDATAYLVPGSDGTCRAVREAMAMGKPVVAADRGMLREIVADNETGLIFDNSADDLFSALHTLVTDRATTRTMGRAAREKAVADYSLGAQARAVRAVYESILG